MRRTVVLSLSIKASAIGLGENQALRRSQTTSSPLTWSQPGLHQGAVPGQSPLMSLSHNGVEEAASVPSWGLENVQVQVSLRMCGRWGRDVVDGEGLGASRAQVSLTPPGLAGSQSWLLIFSSIGFQKQLAVPYWELMFKQRGIPRLTPRDLPTLGLHKCVQGSMRDQLARAMSGAHAPDGTPWAVGPPVARTCFLPPTSNPHAAPGPGMQHMSQGTIPMFWESWRSRCCGLFHRPGSPMLPGHQPQRGTWFCLHLFWNCGRVSRLHSASHAVKSLTV